MENVDALPFFYTFIYWLKKVFNSSFNGNLIEFSATHFSCYTSNLHIKWLIIQSENVPENIRVQKEFPKLNPCNLKLSSQIYTFKVKFNLKNHVGCLKPQMSNKCSVEPNEIIISFTMVNNTINILTHPHLFSKSNLKLIKYTCGKISLRDIFTAYRKIQNWWMKYKM